MLALSQDRQEIGYQEEVGMAISNSAGVAPAGGITAQQSGNSEIKKVVAASMAGTVAEWYEFFIYGVASTLVFGPLFFPKVDSP